MDFKSVELGLYFIVRDECVYVSNRAEFGKIVKNNFIQDDIQNKSIVFPHSYLSPGHFTIISSFPGTQTYSMQLYYNNTVLLAPFTVSKGQTPLHLALKRDKIENTVFSPPPPSIDSKLCPCKQIYDDTTKIKYEPLGYQNLKNNLQINLESVGLYSKYKLQLLFLSKLKAMTYDIETSYISFRKVFFFLN